MGEEADYQLEQDELNMLTFGDHDHEMYDNVFPYGAHRPTHITKHQMAELARQASHDGNILERGMRAMTLEQVLKRVKDDNS